MSLAVVIKGTEGVVLAADSRVTLEARSPDGTVMPINFDNATKLLSFSQPHGNVGAVTYGAAVIGQRTAQSFVPEFEVSLGNGSKTEKEPRPIEVLEFANKLSGFFMERWKETAPADYAGPGMIFIVGGYDPGAAYGKVFLFDVPNRPEPEARNPGENDFGMTWGGQLNIASRIIHGYDPGLIEVLQRELDLPKPKMDQLTKKLSAELGFPIPYPVLPLQDCVNLATFLIRSTATAQSLAIGVRGVGGPIDVAIITRTDGLQHVQRKIIRGEAQ